MKKSSWSKLIRAAQIAAVAILAISLGQLCIQHFFFNLPEPSDAFDCDDATLLMADRFSRVGITTTPLLGNINRDGENYLDCDHVWLVADIAGVDIAFDWGNVCFDSQHFEGYPLTRAELQHFVEQDYKENDDLIAASR